MFRYELGAHILLRKRDDPYLIIEVEILGKAPQRIKAKILSGGWFEVGATRWLSTYEWYSVSRVKEEI